MGLWLVRDVPAWLVAFLMIGGIPAAMAGLDVVFHRYLPHRRLGRHNVVTGIIVSVVGVAYGITVGHCLVSLWDKYTDGMSLAREESANLMAVAQTSRVFGSEVERQIKAEVVQYNEVILHHWQDRIGGVSNPKEIQSLDHIDDLVDGLRPETDAQRFFVQDAVNRLGEARELRQRALDLAGDQQIPGMLWFALAASATGVLTLCLVFGLDDGAVRRLLLALVSLVVATNLFVVVEMNFPYYGAFAVSPASYQAVVHDLTGG